jgi:hypothetical protein
VIELRVRPRHRSGGGITPIVAGRNRPGVDLDSPSVADSSDYGRAILRRGWQDAKRTVRERVLWEIPLLLAAALVAYAIQGDSGEQAALNTALLTALVVWRALGLLFWLRHLLGRPRRLLR